MALSILDDQSREPDESDVASALGPAHRLWSELAKCVAEAHPPVEAQWNFAGAKFGWSLRLKRKDRVILYLIPQAGHFLAGIVLGERAVAAAHEADVPDWIIEMIDNARPYAEGRGVRVPVKKRSDVRAVLELASLKMG